MSATATRWSLVVSTATDRALRQFLAAQGGGRKGDLSRFVEEAVQARILDLSVQHAKAQNAGQAPDAIQSAVEEALYWARHS